MSVTTDKRTPTEEKFETGENFKALCVYTVQVCKNEKHFPKRDRWLLTQEIVKAAVKAYGHVMEANAVEVRTWEDYKLRRAHQVKARAKLKKLNAYIEVAMKALNLEPDRAETWQGYIKPCRELLAKWRESDRKRYKKVLDEHDALKKQRKKQDGHAGNG